MQSVEIGDSENIFITGGNFPKFSSVNAITDTNTEDLYVFPVNFMGSGQSGCFVARLTIGHHNEDICHMVSVSCSMRKAVGVYVIEGEAGLGISRIVWNRLDSMNKRIFGLVLVHVKLIMNSRRERCDSDLNIIRSDIKGLGESRHKVFLFLEVG